VKKKNNVDVISRIAGVLKSLKISRKAFVEMTKRSEVC